MEPIHIIALVLVVVVGFFAYQWWSRRRPGPGGKSGVPRVNRAEMPPSPPGPPAAVADIHPDAVPPAALPSVPGQTTAELTAKEPIQRRSSPPQQQGIGPDAQAPADFGENLRHPERLFHQPTGDAAVPTMTVSDVPAGRASPVSSPVGGHQQQFSPESAQNGGAVIGDSVFAFDGMEPTGFSAF